MKYTSISPARGLLWPSGSSPFSYLKLFPRRVPRSTALCLYETANFDSIPCIHNTREIKASRGVRFNSLKHKSQGAFSLHRPPLPTHLLISRFSRQKFCKYRGICSGKVFVISDISKSLKYFLSHTLKRIHTRETTNDLTPSASWCLRHGTSHKSHTVIPLSVSRLTDSATKFPTNFLFLQIKTSPPV